MRLLHEIAIFQTVKSKVIISLFETVRLSALISLRNLYNSLNSIKESVSSICSLSENRAKSENLTQALATSKDDTENIIPTIFLRL